MPCPASRRGSLASGCERNSALGEGPQGVRDPQEPRQLVLHNVRQRQERWSPLRSEAVGRVGTETSGTAATPSSQIPAIEGAITKGANILIVSATDPAVRGPTLKGAMARGITVVTYDADVARVPTTSVFSRPTSQGIGDIEVDIIAKEMRDAGQLAIVSAAPTATNQNAWICSTKTELKKYPTIEPVKIVYDGRHGHVDDRHRGPADGVPEPQGDHLADHRRGSLAVAAVLDTAKYRGVVRSLAWPHPCR